MSHVLDASVVLSAVLPDEPRPSRKVVAILDECQEVHVPMLWFSEISNALLTAVIRNRVSEANALRLLAKVSELRVTLDRSHPDLVRVFELARQHGITTYGATYLELAIRTNSVLLTKDATLSKSAKSMGVTVLN